ncbi:MAG: imidazole glycerol phosphate synthase subunit HisH [Bacteroidota bacterium]
MDNKIIIIDYELGNLFSVKHAFERLGYETVITNDKQLVAGAQRLVLPGVGAFADAMNNLRKFDLVEPIKDFIASGKPFLGVCLGLQLLFTESEEFVNEKGLNIIEGSVKKFPPVISGKKVKVPQIAWNKVRHPDGRDWQNTPLKEVQEHEYMYFVHSFYVQPDNNKDAITVTNYEEMKYCSGILRDNVFATQFHPEKSALPGLSIFRNWAIQSNKNS